MEEWKDIKGYPGYQVSNFGNVRTYNKTSWTDHHGVRHWKNRVLKQKEQFRRKRVELWNKDGHKTFQVHRIVAVTFLGEPKDKSMTVNHIDGNPRNNKVENLEWLSIKDNIRHGFETGLFPNQIKCILTDEKGKKMEFKSLSQASKNIGRNVGYISNTMKREATVRGKDGTVYHVEMVTLKGQPDG